ncbi:MAG: M16 family metallopeptidase [Planctomycetota bacterium]
MRLLQRSSFPVFPATFMMPHSVPAKLLALSALLLLTLSPAIAQDLQPLRTVEGITEYRLENGLQVLLFPDISAPKVTVNLTVFVGSRHEGYGEAGMAHLLEHMLFKGTPSIPGIPQELKQRGADFNGTTWLDRTNYYQTLSAGDQNLEFAIRLEADRMVNSLIRPEDLASEMTVVRNEFEQGENSPDGVLMERMMAAAWEWHNYGRSTIGNRADIERVPVQNLRRFYERFYQPDNAMLVIAGAFQPEQALDLVQKHFGAIPRPTRELDRTWTEEPAQDGERLVTVRRVGDVPLAGLLYHIPSGAHPDYAALEVLASVLSDEPSGRIYNALVRRRLASSVYGFPFGLHDPGALLFGAQAAEGTEGPALLQALVESVESAAETPFTAEEVERAKSELLKNRELQMANSQAVAVELSEWAAQGDWRLFFLHRDRLETITPADITRVATAYLDRNNRTAGIFDPAREPERVSIPATPDLATLLDGYTGRSAVAQGEVFDAAPLAIESRLKRSRLSSGIRLTQLPRRTRGNSVTFRLNLRYGSLQSLQGLGVAAELLPAVIDRGTGTQNRQQIADAFNQYRARVSFSGNPGNLSVSVQTTRENLLPVLAILQDVLRNPIFPTEELDLVREEQVAALNQQGSEPEFLAFTQATRQISPFDPQDPRYEALPDEQIQRLRAVTAEQLRGIHSQLISAAVGEATVIGDFDPESLQPALEKLTENWKSPVPFVRIPRVHVANPKGSTEVLSTPDKANAATVALMTLPIRDDHPDYTALAIGNFILGSGGLSSRLGDRIRQQDGLSYAIQSSLQTSAADERSAFLIFAISNPDNSPKVLAAIREELQRLLRDGITQAELDAAISGYLQEQQVARSSDTQLAGMLEAFAFLSRDLTFVDRQERSISALTVDQVNAALRKHLNPDRLFVVQAGDFPVVPVSPGSAM